MAGFGETFRKMIGIEPEPDDEITPEEIEAAKAEMRKKEPAPKAVKSAPAASVPAAAEEPKTGFSVKTTSPYEDVAPVISKGSTMSRSYSMNASGPFKMLVIEPKNFEECTKLVDNLKSRKPVIINLEKVETDLARKMFDFLSGATYALNGNVQRVTSNIFIFAPANVDIAAKLSKPETQETATNKSNPWGSR